MQKNVKWIYGVHCVISRQFYSFEVLCSRYEMKEYLIAKCEKCDPRFLKLLILHFSVMIQDGTEVRDAGSKCQLLNFHANTFCNVYMF